jgi:hypothetical protein
LPQQIDLNKKMEECASLAHVSIPIDETSVIVVAVAAAVRFMKWQHDKKKRGGNELVVW